MTGCCWLGVWNLIILFCLTIRKQILTRRSQKYLYPNAVVGQLKLNFLKNQHLLACKILYVQRSHVGCLSGWRRMRIVSVQVPPSFLFSFPATAHSSYFSLAHANYPLKASLLLSVWDISFPFLSPNRKIDIVFFFSSQLQNTLHSTTHGDAVKSL